MPYFAYGSNIDTDQLKKRIGDFQFIGTAILDGYRLKFNKRSTDGSGKANIVLYQQSQVEGVIFDLTESQLEIIDKFEVGYKRTTIFLNNRTVEAVTYIAEPNTIDESLLPTKEYLEKIIRAAKKFRLSETYQQTLSAISVLR